MNLVPGEIVEWQSWANGERALRGIVQHRLDEDRILVRDPKMRYSQVISTKRLKRPRSVPTLGTHGRIA